ncbi:MAG: hypothetical protein ACKOW8_07300, partial [Flavobacteriales bacterium]
MSNFPTLFNLRKSLVGIFILFSSASFGFSCDTLIIDSSYIYVEVDTSEISNKDSLNLPSNELPMRRRDSRYNLNFSG